MQGVGKKKLKIIYNLQIWKINKECKPKRLSWAAYNDLESKREGVFAPKLWMLS
jgi:hypothetical protein